MAMTDEQKENMNYFARRCIPSLTTDVNVSALYDTFITAGIVDAKVSDWADELKTMQVASDTTAVTDATTVKTTHENMDVGA